MQKSVKMKKRGQHNHNTTTTPTTTIPHIHHLNTNNMSNNSDEEYNLMLSFCPPEMRHLFALRYTTLEVSERMKSLALFLSGNPTSIDLSKCNIGQAFIDALANALANRTDTIDVLDLDGNNLSNCNFDSLVTLFSKCTKIQSLWLSSNGIGQRVCVSLAQLLKSPGSNLTHLNLSNNLIDDEGIDILADSLSNNTKLRTLALYGNSKITESGWQSLLKMICDTSSMVAVKESNHTLNCLGIYEGSRNAVASALGVDDANLLFASLNLNRRSRRDDRLSLITRQKMIWAHARGDINIAGSDIPDSAMPVILSWFGDYSNKKNAKLIQYHTLSLSEEGVKRLDSLYRIIREMPVLLENSCVSISDGSVEQEYNDSTGDEDISVSNDADVKMNAAADSNKLEERGESDFGRDPPAFDEATQLRKLLQESIAREDNLKKEIEDLTSKLNFWESFFTE